MTSYENIVGTWGVGAFENDAAADWAEGYFMEFPSWDQVQSILEAQSPPRIDAEDAWIKVAAAAVVAAASDGASNLQPYGPGLMKVLGAPPAALRQLALLRLDQVQQNSELAERWKAGGGLSHWAAELDVLRVELR